MEEKEYPHTKLLTKILKKPYSCVQDLQFTKPFSPWTSLCVCIYYKGVTCHLRANIKITIYRPKILSVVLYRCEPWSLILTEKRRLRVVEDRLLRKIFRPNMDEVTGNGDDYITRSFKISNPHEILFGWSGKEEWDRQGMWHGWGE